MTTIKNERLAKTLQRSYGESQRNMSVAINALKRREDRRIKHLEESALRKKRRIELEERRLETEKEARMGDRELALRRIKLEKKRVDNYSDGAKDAA